MKLAEALLLRADMQKKLASLRDRIVKNAVVQQGDKPHENPEKLLREAADVLDELEELVIKINQVNLKNKLADGRTLTEVLARRDSLKQHHSMLEAAIAGTHKEPSRYSLKEIKWVATVDVAKLQKHVEELARKLRKLNAVIQEANWKINM